MKTILMPEYMARFQCLGPDCKANCCDNDWIIVIDKATYEKYSHVNDADFRSGLIAGFKLTPETKSNNYYAELLRESDGRCPFHSEGYCKIQQKYGPEYLCGPCNTYPRSLNIVNQVFEMSGLPSCPEIARLLLFDPHPIKFTNIEYASDAQFVYKVLNTENLKSNWQYFTLDMRRLIIEILQDSNVSLADRLIFTGLFFQKGQDLIAQSKLQDIPQIIVQYRRMLKTGGINDLGGNMNKNLPLQYELLKAICEIKATETPEYQELYLNTIANIGDAASYEKVLNSYYLKFMSAKDYIFENYLVNYVFGTMSPLSDSDDIFESYVTLIIHYALMRFHLIGMAGFKKGMDENLVVNTFVAVSRFIEHDNSFLGKICQLLREKGFFNLAHMVVLIQ